MPRILCVAVGLIVMTGVVCIRFFITLYFLTKINLRASRPILDRSVVPSAVVEEKEWIDQTKRATKSRQTSQPTGAALEEVALETKGHRPPDERQ